MPEKEIGDEVIVHTGKFFEWVTIEQVVEHTTQFGNVYEYGYQRDGDAMFRFVWEDEVRWFNSPYYRSTLKVA